MKFNEESGWFRCLRGFLLLNLGLTQVHALRKKEIDPITLLPDRIDKKMLAEFIDAQLEFAKEIINST